MASGSRVEMLETRRMLCSAVDELAPLATAATVQSVSSPAPLVAAAVAAPTFSLSSKPLLHSRPSARAQLYLDVDGDPAPSWTPQIPATPAYDLDGDARSFNPIELGAIREIWARVAEAFSPFNVNVTTADPGAANDHRTLRVVIGGDGSWEPGNFSGVAVGRYGDADGINRVYTFAQGTPPASAAGTSIHEAGHGFGLAHQSTYDSSGTKVREYAFGEGGVAPFMGQHAFSRGLWWYGTSSRGATHYQDDLATIANTYAIGYRPDDHGSAVGSATRLAASGGTFAASGVLHHHADKDWFAFDVAAAGTVSFAVDPATHGPMLDVRLELRDAAGRLITLRQSHTLGELLIANVAAGSYRLGVMSGQHTVNGVATRYGEVGQYTLRGRLTNSSLQQPFGGTAPRLGSPTGATTVIEAEHYDVGGPGVAYSAVRNDMVPDYRSGELVDTRFHRDVGAYVDGTHPGEWYEYTVDVASSGTYDLAFRLAATYTAGGIFRLEVDGVDVSGPLVSPHTGGDFAFQTVTRPGVRLTAGRHVLRLVMVNHPTNSGAAIAAFDKILVTHAGAQRPFRGSPFAVGATIQAEDFDLGGRAFAYHDTTTGNEGGAYRTDVDVDLRPTSDAGGGYRLASGKAGEWLEYTVDVATPGPYKFELRLANTASGGRVHVEVDGFDMTGRISVPNTGSFDRFATVTRGGFTLARGRHVVRVKLDANASGSGFAASLNWLRLASNPPPVWTSIASAAATVRGGQYAGTNFGAAPELRVERNPTPDRNSDAYLRFTLPTLPDTFVSAKLRVFGRLTYQYGMVVSAYASTNTGWSESRITWNDRPATSALISQTVLGGTAAKWYEWDLTRFIRDERAAGRRTITIVLRNPHDRDAAFLFNSDEAATNRPQLVVTGEPPV